MDVSQHTIASQAAQLDRGEFREWIAKRQKAVDEITTTLVGQVEQGNLEPVAGARIAACVTGSAFGYEEFHPRAGQPTAETLLDADLLGNVTRSRELAGSR